MLINDILSFLKVARGSIKKEEIDPHQILDDIFEAENPAMSYPKTNFLIQENLSTITGYFKMIKQGFWNLIYNALKFSANEDIPEIEIKSILKDWKNIWVISDNGIGIEFFRQENIFKVFEQAAAKDFSGNGIGLTLVKRILKKHGGNFWVKSLEEEGSSFNFYF